jgi:hypothetical protein
MKYLFILLFLPLFGKAQNIPTYDSLGNVIYYTEDTIHLPYSVAKKIAKELVGCDSAKAILELTKEQLTLTEQKVTLKDSIISGHVQKGIMYEERIKNEQLKFDTQNKWVDQLRKQNKKLKVKLVFTKITLSGIIGGLTYLYFTK